MTGDDKRRTPGRLTDCMERPRLRTAESSSGSRDRAKMLAGRCLPWPSCRARRLGQASHVGLPNPQASDGTLRSRW